MRTNLWLLGGLLLSSGLLAQQVTNAPPAGQIETPTLALAVTNASPNTNNIGTSTPKKSTATVPTKKSSAAKKGAKSSPKTVTAKKAGAMTYDLRTVPLKPGPAIVVASNVNVRGQARLKSEVVTRVTKGQEVQVLEEITLKNSGPEEPSAWAKIALPPNAHVWASALFIDATTKTVKPKRLNLRSGPGENYSVVGQLEQGALIKEVGAKEDWLEIEPPPNTYGFVAAQYLRQETPAEVASASSATTAPSAVTAAPPIDTTPLPPTTQTTVAETPSVAAATSDTPANVAPPAAAAEAAAAVATSNQPPTNIVTTPSAPESDEPPPPRIVLREGILRGSTSIQAPSHFEIYSPETGKIINYLYTTSHNVDLNRYKGLRIIVTGEEGLDERWRNTPVLTIQRIQVIE